MPYSKHSMARTSIRLPANRPKRSRSYGKKENIRHSLFILKIIRIGSLFISNRIRRLQSLAMHSIRNLCKSRGRAPTNCCPISERKGHHYWRKKPNCPARLIQPCMTGLTMPWPSIRLVWPISITNWPCWPNILSASIPTMRLRPFWYRSTSSILKIRFPPRHW